VSSCRNGYTAAELPVGGLRGGRPAFADCDPEAFLKAIYTSLEACMDQKLWLHLLANAMDQDFSWNKNTQAYLELYKQLVA
jgi:glycogen synthase